MAYLRSTVMTRTNGSSKSKATKRITFQTVTEIRDIHDISLVFLAGEAWFNGLASDQLGSRYYAIIV